MSQSPRFLGTDCQRQRSIYSLCVAGPDDLRFVRFASAAALVEVVPG